MNCHIINKVIIAKLEIRLTDFCVCAGVFVCVYVFVRLSVLSLSHTNSRLPFFHYDRWANADDFFSRAHSGDRSAAYRDFSLTPVGV